MSTHTEHRVHANSVAAWHSLNLTAREERICADVEHHGISTDREICERLGQADLNFVRPRITHLIELGALAEYDTARCKTTGMTVRRVYLGSGIPRPKGPSLTDTLIAYFRAAERERCKLLWAEPEWCKAAEAVNRLI